MSILAPAVKLQRTLAKAVDEYMEKTYQQHRYSCDWNFWTEYLIKLIWKQVNEVKMLREHFRDFNQLQGVCELYGRVMRDGRNAALNQDTSDDEVGFD
jgi:hypothetical protein